MDSEINSNLGPGSTAEEVHTYLATFISRGVKKRWGSIFKNLSRDPFIVCGDSLVCACLERALLGAEHYAGKVVEKGKGAEFQTLSVVYQAEWFLKELQDRGAEFRVLFCQDTKKLWFGAGRLARELVEAHITKNTSIACDCVSNYQDLPALVKKNRPGFFMCKVGWKADTVDPTTDVALPLSLLTTQGMHSPLLALYVRSMVMLVVSDVNVGVVVDLQLLSRNNALQFIDESDFTGFCLYGPEFYDSFAPVRTLELVGSEADTTKDVSSVGAASADKVDDPRLQLALASVASLFEDTDGTLPASMAPEIVLFLAKAFLLHTCLCSVLPLTYRSHDVRHLVSDSAQASDVEHFVGAIAAHLAASVSKAADEAADDSEGEQKGKVLVMCDVLDARMLHVILLFVDVCATENGGGGAFKLNLAQLCGDDNALWKAAVASLDVHWPVFVESLAASATPVAALAKSSTAFFPVLVPEQALVSKPTLAAVKELVGGQVEGGSSGGSGCRSLKDSQFLKRIQSETFEEDLFGEMPATEEDTDVNAEELPYKKEEYFSGGVPVFLDTDAHDLFKKREVTGPKDPANDKWKDNDSWKQQKAQEAKARATRIRQEGLFGILPTATTIKSNLEQATAASSSTVTQKQKKEDKADKKKEKKLLKEEQIKAKNEAKKSGKPGKGKDEKDNKKGGKGKKEKEPKMSKADIIREKNEKKKIDDEVKSIQKIFDKLCKDTRKALDGSDPDFDGTLEAAQRQVKHLKEKYPQRSIDAFAASFSALELEIYLTGWTRAYAPGARVAIRQGLQNEVIRGNGRFVDATLERAAGRAAKMLDTALKSMDFLQDVITTQCQPEHIRTLHILSVITLECIGFGDLDHVVKAPKKLKLEKDATGKREYDAAKKKYAAVPLHWTSPNGENALDVVKFQMRYCGAQMPRVVGTPDEKGRVTFVPDDWQKELLDAVDDEKSVLVVAPTSAGKTFVAYYALRKVLEADDEGVLIYVCPTLSLALQTTAEIPCIYRKEYRTPGRNMTGIFTENVRENLRGCQLLVTVPSGFYNLFTNPEHQQFVQKVRYVVFDEFHNLFGENGATWETMVTLTQSPFLALSATIADPQRLESWLKPMQDSKNQDVLCIPSLKVGKQIERYNDLSMHLWGPVGETATDRIIPVNPIGSVGGDVLAVLNREKRPMVLSMTPEHCMALYDALAICAAKMKDDAATGELHKDWAKTVEETLEPSKYFSSKMQIDLESSREYGNLLKQHLVDLYVFAPQRAVGVTDFFHQELDNYFGLNGEYFSSSALQNDVSLVCKHQIAMLRDLQAKDMLPAIIFNMTDDICVKFAVSMATELKAADDENKKKNSREIEDRIRGVDEQIKDIVKQMANCRDAMDKQMLEEQETTLKDEKMMLENKRSGIDLNYTFLRRQAITIDDIRHYCRLSRRVSTQEIEEDPLLHALQRGIGVHSHTVTTRYREAVEYFYRTQRISVIFSTETLAQGMNMPARTVVFAGDDPTLNAVNYTQMSGRAGRRGRDDRGNVVHIFIPQAKVERLMAGHLPLHSGHTTLSPTSVMKLVHLQAGCLYNEAKEEESKQGQKVRRGQLRQGPSDHSRAIESMFDFAKRLVEFPYKSILKEAEVDRLARVGKKTSVSPSTIELNSRKLLLYFIYKYMQEEELFTPGTYVPLPITGLATLMHEQRPANFVVVALLRSGVIRDYITNPNLFDKNSPDVTHHRDMHLIHIFAHLYGRMPVFTDDSANPLKTSLGEDTDNNASASVPNSAAADPTFAGVSGEYATASMRFEQPPAISGMLESYNKRVLNLLTDVLSKYHSNFSKSEGVSELQCRLPSSGIVLPSAAEASKGEVDMKNGLFSFCQNTSIGAKVRSPFVSMAWGRGDSYATAEELSTTISALQCVTPSHIPIIDCSYSKLDKYLPLFYITGRETLQAETEVPASEMYDVLLDFCLFLNCISATLQHFLVANEASKDQDGMKKERLFAASLQGMAQRYHQKFEREYKKSHLTLR